MNPENKLSKVGRYLLLSYNQYISAFIIKFILKISLRDLETLSKTLFNIMKLINEKSLEMYLCNR